MVEKVTAVEINAALALERLKHREKLLNIVRGSGWELFFATFVHDLVRTLPAVLLAGYMSYAEQKPQYLALVILFVLCQAWPARDRRFDALIELLDLDHFPQKKTDPSIPTQGDRHDHRP